MGTEELAERLAGIADELADLAMERLRDATGGLRRGEEPDPAVLAEERRLTRARRAVEKAAAILHEGPGTADADR